MIDALHYTWAWNVSAIFPDIPNDKFSHALQSLHDYGLHVVEASDIVHHLKFNHFEGMIPDQITNLFSNPFNYVIGIIALFALIFVGYSLIKCWCRSQSNQPGYHAGAASDYPLPVPSAPPLTYQFIYPRL